VTVYARDREHKSDGVSCINQLVLFNSIIEKKTIFVHSACIKPQLKVVQCNSLSKCNITVTE